MQPSTIDGHRSAIADKLGNFQQNIRKNENITCLLDSFPQRQIQGSGGIPSWNLSLVLHQLTKALFEPLEEAPLKLLIFKSVFLLALGSVKCRSEIHAWQNKNIRLKYPCSPHPTFLSKNLLAKSVQIVGPQCLYQPWSQTLDKSLKSDRSPFPVRVLHYYLNRTSDLRQNKELVLSPLSS